jgi:hypothetical protein
MTARSARERVVKRLQQDLIGPLSDDEMLKDSPAEVYMSGILYAQKRPISSAEPEEAQIASVEDADQPQAPQNSFRPSSIGLSFAIKPHDGGSALLRLNISLATYEPVAIVGKGGKENFTWHRKPHSAEISIEVPRDAKREIQKIPDIPGLGVWIRCRKFGSILLVTAMLVNMNVHDAQLPSGLRDLGNFYQVSFTVEADADFGSIVPKPVVGSRSDDLEVRSAELLYRDSPEFAVGHTCSATWQKNSADRMVLRADWLPAVIVPSASPNGDEKFFGAVVKPGENFVLGARWLSEASDADVFKGLTQLCDCYSDWIASKALEAESLPARLEETATGHLRTCRVVLDRMRDGVNFLANDVRALKGFRLANRALWLQNEWKRTRAPKVGTLVWRPFQLAFALLCLRSSTTPEDEARSVMDLLWFPTGGGKTEAYLLLTAFTMFLRRMKAEGSPRGAGVTVFMRYTLRLLTAQQYQRAAAMILACDMIRRGDEFCPDVSLPAHFKSDEAFSIGLWVGRDTTPNLRKEVGSTSSPAQVADCPICGQLLDWALNESGSRVFATCQNECCTANGVAGHLPFWTVDEDIYEELPTLLIGTADKFVQIVSKPKTGRLFGLGDAARQPPDLIIQDELHLISGPLGTMAGLFETAIDAMCSRGELRPKIIGSTATIRRAHDQINSLFDREALQFPPPGLDQNNSGFAFTEDSRSGRLYLGITSAGRTASYIYQAIASSLLQAAADPSFSTEEQDHYWTLVGYFNSLRELGSASIIMQDDVTHSIQLVSKRRNEIARHLQPPLELTSRVKSDEIKDRLLDLERTRDSGGAADIVLASNMISVGMDIPRLGLMLVNGQPKTIAEYIQATSRVGRSNVPGLVLTLYNSNKMRDRSRYENFASWHGALYRDVEATGVTPFAPRARDKALHAPFVAMVRHLVPGMLDSPALVEKNQQEIKSIIELICKRISRVDKSEEQVARKELDNFLAAWLRRGALPRYWHDWSDDALLVSAEKSAAAVASGFAKGLARSTPNTLRAVEPSTKFVITEVNG